MYTQKAKSKHHLKQLIAMEIHQHGNQCSLNHIDVSGLDDLSFVFASSDFNGDISQWDTSNVECMDNMFERSKFNGDISGWNTSKVRRMEEMFYNSAFRGDIASWNLSSLKRTYYVFNGDLMHDSPLGVLAVAQGHARLPDSYPYKKEFKQLVDLAKSFEMESGPMAMYLYEQLKTSPSFQPSVVEQTKTTNSFQPLVDEFSI